MTVEIVAKIGWRFRPQRLTTMPQYTAQQHNFTIDIITGRCNMAKIVDDKAQIPIIAQKGSALRNTSPAPETRYRRRRPDGQLA